MALSKLSEKCKKCEFSNNCDEKRMELCGYIKPKQNLASVVGDIAMPNTADLLVKHSYREIKVNDGQTITIDLEDIKEQMRKEIYKPLYCDFLQNGG